MKDCDNLTEVSIERHSGETLAEYFCNTIPRVGESIDIEIEHTKGVFKVVDVIHIVIEVNNGQIGSYVKVLCEDKEG